MTADDWRILFFTVWTAGLSVLLILPPGLLLAWLLGRKSWHGKTLVETAASLPLVLPPVATGLILLYVFGRRGPVGSWFHDTWGVEIVFTWKAVVVALGVMSFPLLVRTSRTAFEQVDLRCEQVARTLGANPWRVWWTITLPLAGRGIMSGVLLAFARAVGEFGATMMLAGNIPGVTSTLSLTIYHSIQLGRDDRAWRLVLASLAIAFAALLFSEYLAPGRKRK